VNPPENRKRWILVATLLAVSLGIGGVEAGWIFTTPWIFTALTL